MKAEELRIGNFVKSGYQYCYINFFLGATMVDLELIGFEYTDGNHEEDVLKLEPILLTEEWLLKFGFSDDGCLDLGNYTDSKLSFNPNSNQLRLVDSGGRFLTHDNLKHVHQLQNLYFALTGEELTKKDEK